MLTSSTQSRILVFGDSIPYGAWDSEGGWVDRLKREAHRETVESNGAHKIQVLNLGIGSDTSTKLLARLETEITARQSASWPFVFVFSFGANDERSRDGRVETPLDLFEANVRAIIATAKRYSSFVYFTGIAPIALPSVMFKSQEYSDARIREYDARLQKIVEAEGLSYIPIRPHFTDVDQAGLFSYDNIHPNEKGHELIARIVSQAVSAA